MGRRLVALLVDWVLCYVIAASIVGHDIFTVTDSRYEAAQTAALLLFVFEVYLLTAISGLTVGKRLLGLRTVRTDLRGQYRFSGLAPGSYRILGTFEYEKPDADSMTTAGARTVTLSEATDTAQDLDLYAHN